MTIIHVNTFLDADIYYIEEIRDLMQNGLLITPLKPDSISYHSYERRASLFIKGEDEWQNETYELIT